jgi:hypothetical protein
MNTPEQPEAKYVELRDRKAELKKLFEEDEAKIAKLMDGIGDKLREIMHANGVESMKTPHGTVHFVPESATVAD